MYPRVSAYIPGKLAARTRSQDEGGHSAITGFHQPARKSSERPRARRDAELVHIVLEPGSRPTRADMASSASQ